MGSGPDKASSTSILGAGLFKTGEVGTLIFAQEAHKSSLEYSMKKDILISLKISSMGHLHFF